jgi:MSHA pilin protein MshA
MTGLSVQRLNASKSVRGFTLIELVVVITILGILSAFAVPRFIALQTRARSASIESLQGAIRSAASLTHSMWLVTGSPGSVPMEGAVITMTNGYPSLADIDDTLVDASGYTYDQTTGTFSKIGAPNAATCMVAYTPPTVVGDPPSIIYDPSCT